LAEPRTWRANDPVDLYRDSCGYIVLAGPLPDAGASEYGGSSLENTLTCGD